MNELSSSDKSFDFRPVYRLTYSQIPDPAFAAVPEALSKIALVFCAFSVISSPLDLELCADQWFSKWGSGFLGRVPNGHCNLAISQVQGICL